MTPGNSAPFIDRVATLHQAWEERRNQKHMSTPGTFEAQFETLLRVHGWAEGAIGDIRRVYGEETPILLSPPPDGPAMPAFQVAVAGTYRLTLSLVEDERAGRDRWRIQGALTVTADGNSLPLKSSPRGSTWTRRNLEDALLHLMTAYERGLAT